jgi:hypothetical protein
VDLRRATRDTEDPMTEDRMALVELLQKSGEADFLRAVAEALSTIVIFPGVIAIQSPTSAFNVFAVPRRKKEGRRLLNSSESRKQPVAPRAAKIAAST